MLRKLTRKHLLIYPRFQLLLILVNSLFSIGTFVISILGTSHVFSKFKEIGVAIRLPENHAYFKLIEFQSNDLYLTMIISFVASLSISGLIILLMSHRLAGPIVRMKTYFKEIASTGHYAYKLKFRKGDFFYDLPDSINQGLERLISAPPSTQDKK